MMIIHRCAQCVHADYLHSAVDCCFNNCPCDGDGNLKKTPEMIPTFGPTGKVLSTQCTLPGSFAEATRKETCSCEACWNLYEDWKCKLQDGWTMYEDSE